MITLRRLIALLALLLALFPWSGRVRLPRAGRCVTMPCIMAPCPLKCGGIVILR